MNCEIEFLPQVPAEALIRKETFLVAAFCFRKALEICCAFIAVG